MFQVCLNTLEFRSLSLIVKGLHCLVREDESTLKFRCGVAVMELENSLFSKPLRISEHNRALKLAADEMLEECCKYTPILYCTVVHLIQLPEYMRAWFLNRWNWEAVIYHRLSSPWTQSCSTYHTPLSFCSSWFHDSQIHFKLSHLFFIWTTVVLRPKRWLNSSLYQNVNLSITSR